MKKAKTFRKILSIALIMVMVLGTSVTSFAATTFSDINGHWAATSINYGVTNGFIKGYADSTFKPDNPVTRAEFSRMLNVAFGITNTQVVSFYDVPSNEWYYQEVRKAVAAGYINGYEDNTFRPNSKITRQEAAAMIASVIPAAATTPSLAGLSDNGSIADWARAAVTKVYAKGYMRGDNNNMYNPLKSLTRAEAATILSSIISKENIVSDDTTLSTNGKSISDTIYANDLIISKSLGTGSVDISDSMVLGTMSVLGGGTGSIEIYDTNIHNMSVAKTTGDVRVFLSGDSTVKDTVMENGAILEHKSLRGLGFQNIYFNGGDLGTQEVSLIGSFKQLYINTASTIKSTSGTISNVNITRDAAGDVVKLGGTYNSVTFEAKCLFELLTGKITTLTVNSGAASSTVKLNSGTSITTAVVDGIKTAFTGTGTISRLEANVNDITYETKPARIVTASGVSRPPVLSADTTAPAPAFAPANSATNVLANTKITITFDEPIYKSNGNAISTSSTSSTLTDIQAIVQLRETSSTGTSKAYAATISSDKKTITITPNAVLAVNTNYYVIIVSGTIEDANGNENSKITSTFKTGTTDVAAPVPTFAPANGATNVALDANITIAFNENVYNSSGNLLTTSNLSGTTIILKKTNASGTDVPYTATVTGNDTILINPDSSMVAGTYYVAIKASALKDQIGNLVPLTSITFTTVGVTVPIDISAITGVTVPVTGGTPVSTATATSEYTATVTWNGNPTTFAASTSYTATITITPKTGYTLTGVAANFFTVTGATSDTNPANSGIVTAVFPATAPLQTIAQAKSAADAAVTALTVTNDTSSAQILSAVNTVITNPNITAAYTTAFSKTNATAGFAGAITGVITLTNSVGPVTDTVTINKVIAALPLQTLDQAKSAADAAIASLTISNTTTGTDALNTVNAVITNANITAAFTTPFSKTDATPGFPGAITGIITLTNSVGGATVTVDVSRVIPALPQSVEQAKTLADGAILALTVTNTTIDSDILSAVNSVITNNTITSAFTVAFTKTVASGGTPGTITGTITLTNSADSTTATVTVNKTIAAL